MFLIALYGKTKDFFIRKSRETKKRSLHYTESYFCRRNVSHAARVLCQSGLKVVKADRRSRQGAQLIGSKHGYGPEAEGRNALWGIRGLSSHINVRICMLLQQLGILCTMEIILRMKMYVFPILLERGSRKWNLHVYFCVFFSNRASIVSRAWSFSPPSCRLRD